MKNLILIALFGLSVLSAFGQSYVTTTGYSNGYTHYFTHDEQYYSGWDTSNPEDKLDIGVINLYNSNDRVIGLALLETSNIDEVGSRDGMMGVVFKDGSNVKIHLTALDDGGVSVKIYPWNDEDPTVAADEVYLAFRNKEISKVGIIWSDGQDLYEYELISPNVIMNLIRSNEEAMREKGWSLSSNY